MSVVDTIAAFTKEKATESEIAQLRRVAERIRRASFTLRQKKNLAQETEQLRTQFAAGAELDQLAIPAFAAVTEAVRRVFRKSLHDVQLIGGLVLHQGKIAEMRSGEGKTLTAILPAYLNALRSQVHIATTSDYLAERDRNWMGPVFDLLGITTGTILTAMNREQRAANYHADIVYATNHELAFDELIDHLAYSDTEKIFPGFHYAIIDEIDSILIDEARTPLIVAENLTAPQSNLRVYAQVIQQLKPQEDYVVDAALRAVVLSEKGLDHVESLLSDHGLYEHKHIDKIFYLTNALKAATLFARDRDYIVENGRVYIVDEFTGRVMRDRRFTEGIHQAIEAKENVMVRPSEVILAETTYQNFFGRYEKLAGLTGTIAPEDEELAQIFNLRAITVPTEKTYRRKDLPDLFFLNDDEKFQALATQARNYAQNGRPVLIGTRTVETSEKVSAYLTRQGIEHQLLNAKEMNKEKEVVFRAGNPGTITVATNMAGRGVDIILHPEARSAGGLVVLGTERHFSRRIDRQLAGRAGRQGEEGVSQFFLAPTDELVVSFGSKKLHQRLKTLTSNPLGVQDEKLSLLWEEAQARAEARDRGVRLFTLTLSKYIEEHRSIVYGKRDAVLHHKDLLAELPSMLEGEMAYLVRTITLTKDRPDWDLVKLFVLVEAFMEDRVVVTRGLQSARDTAQMTKFLQEQALRRFTKMTELYPREELATEFRSILLAVIDRNFAEHLQLAEALKERLPLLDLGAQNPEAAFEGQLHTHFEIMLVAIRSEALRTFFAIQRGQR